MATKTWTDELKAEVVKSYTDANPTPENSSELVNRIAEEVEMSPNGVRMVLMQAKVYLKKEPKAAAKKTGATGETKRVSKEDSIGALKEAIAKAGAPVDEDILSKLTGKAAVYFLSVVNAVQAAEADDED